MAAANFGTLLGNIVASTLEAGLTQEQLETWGWRLPFWSGILVSLSGFYLKSSHHGEPHKCAEHAQNNDDAVTTNQSTTTNPIRLAFGKGFYLSFVWMATYMKDLLDPPVPHSFTINAMSLLISVCMFFPLAGKLSDRTGRCPVMTLGALGLGIVGPILFWLIRQGNALSALVAQCLLGVFLSCWGAPMCAWLVESFDPAARLTSVAIGYNVAQATAGGLAPMIATVLNDDVSRQAPGYILTGLATISLTGLWVVAPPPENARFTPAFYHGNGGNAQRQQFGAR
eukprot:scaffold1619_cov161-Amphora_coffeaeformis.AAC.12